MMSLCIAAVLMLATACSRNGSVESGRAHAEAEEEGVTFNEARGLYVPPETADFIELEIAHVEQRTVASTFSFSAQVYRAASEMRFAALDSAVAPTSLASGCVSPSDAAKLHEGQTVSVRRAPGEHGFSGRVASLKRGLEQASGQVEVLISVSDSGKPLAVGEFISVTVPLGGDEKVMVVPQNAVLQTTEGNFVYTVSGEHFVRTPVELGVVNHEFVEVTGGLYEGDRVVVKPVMTLWLAELQFIRGGKACADGH